MKQGEHLTTTTKTHAATIRTVAWVNEENTKISLFEAELRNPGVFTSFNIWITEEQTLALIQNLHQHLNNLKSCDLELLANGQLEQAA